MPHRSWPRQRLYFSLFFFAYFGFAGIFTPYASLYFAARDINPAQIGILMSLMQITRIFGPNIWGAIADHTQRPVWILRISATASLLVFFGIFFNVTFAQFFIWMVVLNLCTSAHGPMSEALVLAHLRADLSQYGRIRMWGSIGFIVAVGSGGTLLDWLGIDFTPWLAVMFLGLVLISSTRLQASPPLPHLTPVTPLLRLLRQREVWSFFASTFLMVAAHYSLYIFYSLFLAQAGYSKSVIGLMWSLGVLVEIVFFFYQAPVLRRFSVRALMLAALGLATLRFLLIGYGAASLMLLLVAQVLHAATFGVHHACAVITLQRWFAGPLQARGQALYTSISYGLGGTLGGLGFSLVWELAGAQAVFVLAAGLCFFGLIAAAVSYHWQQTAN